jgi:GTP pyrophosphokinase
MVTLRRDQTVSFNGSGQLEPWLDSLVERMPALDRDSLRRACERAHQCEVEATNADRPWPYALGCYQIGREMVAILVDLQADVTALPAALLYRSVREGRLSLSQVEKEFGKPCMLLIEGVLRMAAMSTLLNPTRRSVFGQQSGQIDNVRKMLVAMIDDVRVALVKLAERTVILRAVKDEEGPRRLKVAREIFDIYAPLAHRLGVGQLKWELEDLSFRYLQPDDYHHIASLLDEKRLDRENYIAAVTADLEKQLSAAGIKAEVKGRVKHIYSIWRKMQEKHLDFHQVYDVRAVRVLVPEVRDCYAVLGIVHSLWQHLPKEFDDYIANPKSNGYQSLHTAVVGPERKLLEVQIRTFQMDADAELGVCAHWRYKEGGDSDRLEDYERKIAWLRQVLSWHDELGGNMPELGAELRLRDTQRIYVFTPEGHVVEMEEGSTPIDFAYHIHTEVGHHCRGAKVNGKVVPLNYKLKTGEQVEILAVREGGPSRDWLMPSLGYVRTPTARNRIQQWFKHQSRDTHLQQGRQLLERELKRLALDVPPGWDKLARELHLASADDMLVALGAGDLRLSQVTNLLQTRTDVPQRELAFTSRQSGEKDADIDVAGEGHLLTRLAECCKPLPGDAIMGYITLGRGVTVHRADCHHLLTLQSEDPARIVEVNWGASDHISYPVDIFVRTHDRPGLLRDLLSVLANEGVNVTALHTDVHRNESSVTMLLTIETESLDSLGDLLARMDQLPDVLEVRRYKK